MQQVVFFIAEYRALDVLLGLEFVVLDITHFGVFFCFDSRYLKAASSNFDLISVLRDFLLD